MVDITKEEKLTHEEWQAFLLKFEECTCTPGSALACPSCQDYNRREYGVELLEAQECSCLPDLPDGRVNGGRGGCCQVCEADSQSDEIPFGGE